MNFSSLPTIVQWACYAVAAIVLLYVGRILLYLLGAAIMGVVHFLLVTLPGDGKRHRSETPPEDKP